MRRTINLFVALLAFVLVGCQDINLQPLEQRVGKLESDFAQFISAQQGGDYITDVKELKDGSGAVVGYEITFKEHGTVVVRNGANGTDGHDGEDGDDGDAFFKSVTVGDGVVTFVTADDQTFVIPMEEAFALVIEKKSYGSLEAGQVITIPFTLTGADANTTVSTFTSGGYKAVVNADNIVVTAPDPIEDAQVLVIADNGAGKTSTVILNFMAKVIVTVADFQLCAKGDGETVVTTLNAEATTVTADGPDWVSVASEGKKVNFTFAANPDDKNARLGKVTLNIDVNGDASTHEVLVAQAAAGCLAAFDSFAGSELDENWKGDIASADASLSDGALHLHGNGSDTGYPLYWYGAPIRRRASDTEHNTFIVTVDIKADGGEGGLQLFNSHGYDGGTYSFDVNDYRYTTAAGAGADSGGFYGWNKGGLCAADPWNCLTGKVTEWIRLEISNVDRGVTGNHIDPWWAAVYIYSLEPDADGILQKKDMIWYKEMWWWNDGGYQPTTDFGYAAVWGKSSNYTSMKNFMISYTNK